MNKFLEKNKYKIVLLILLLLIVIGIIIYLSQDFSRVKILKNHVFLYNDKVIKVGGEKFKDSREGIKYTFSVCLRTENIAGNSVWSRGESIPKTVIYNHGSPNILYDRRNNTILVQIGYKSPDGVNETYDFVLDHFRAQLWQNLVITVNNRIVKVFLDGKLHTAKKLPSSPWKSNRTMSIGEIDNNFNGYVGFIDYYNRVLDEKEIDRLNKTNKNKYPDRLLNYEQSERKRENDEKIGKVIKKIF